MKSTFQKPDATYPHGSLREQPLEKYSNAGIKEAIEKNLRTIPCSENNWKDGQELEEGRDYEVITRTEAWKRYGRPDISGDGLVAVPVQETEDELWFEAAQIFSKYTHTADRFVRNEELKSKFTIKRIK